MHIYIYRERERLCVIVCVCCTWGAEVYERWDGREKGVCERVPPPRGEGRSLTHTLLSQPTSHTSPAPQVAALTHPTAACPLLVGEGLMVMDDDDAACGGVVVVSI